MIRSLIATAALLISAIPALAQKSPEDSLKALTAADGLQVELFASEPMLINPTGIDVDHKGRVWVTEAVNYRRVNFGRPIIRPEGDRIVVLVDKNGDGKADESVVFYQGKELYGPLGLCVAPNADGKGLRVFVCQSPDILVFEDKDGDLKADGPPKKLLTGFDGFDHDHGVHSPTIGPDGKLYFTVGDRGVKDLQSADGKGRKWTSNETDCRAGTVWRCDLDGKNLELIAHNFRNSYKCCVNSFGEVWLSDNDDDGNRQTRICYVMPGGNYGYHPRGRGESHWHEEQPGIVHKTLGTGFGSPTGITFYEGALLPEKYRGQLLHTDAGTRELRCFRIKPKGAGYELETDVMLSSKDGWFRPSDVCVAPDGSVFVADWYDPGVGGHGMGDTTRGRIYRVTPNGHKGYKVPEVKFTPRKGAKLALGSSCQATRAGAIEAIRQMSGDDVYFTVGGAGVIEDVIQGKKLSIELIARSAWRLAEAYDKKLSIDENPLNAMSYMGVFDVFANYDEKGIKNGLSLYLRILPSLTDRGFFPVLSHKPPKDLADMLDFFTDPDGKQEHIDTAISREVLIQLRGVNAEKAVTSFYRLAKKYDGKDHFYRAALNIACGTDPKRRDAILADFPKHFPEWNDKVADLVWELRPKSMINLQNLLTDSKSSESQKARMVDLLAMSDDPTVGTTMIKFLSSGAVPPQVKARAIANLKLFLPNKWKALAANPDLRAAVDRLLDSPQTRGLGLELVVAANLTAAAEGIAKLALDSTASLEDRTAAVRTLGKLSTPKAVVPLVTLANSATNSLRLEAIAALAGHVRSNAKDPSSQQALAALQSLVTAKDVPDDVRKAAVASLAGVSAGAGWLLDLHEKKKMPASVVAEAGRLLRNGALHFHRNRAEILFPVSIKIDPKKLVPADLAKRPPGNIERGKQVWAASFNTDSQCAKCHTVRGVGGKVGPDLSMIGKKASRENLFESILQPSKAIADQYIQQEIETVAGQKLTGLVVKGPAFLTLTDANGKFTNIRNEDVESSRALKTSIMPEDIAASLSEEELIDLVAYLQTLQSAAFTPEEWKLAGSEKTVRPNEAGYFEVKNAATLSQQIESPTDQDAEVLLGIAGNATLTLNGTEGFRGIAKTATPGQTTVPVKLKKGRNALEFKFDAAGGFYFTLLSPQEIKITQTSP